MATGLCSTWSSLLTLIVLALHAQAGLLTKGAKDGIQSVDDMEGLVQADGTEVLKQADDMEGLVQAHVVFRHGDRTPCNFYPNDPHKDRSEWPVGPGQLTAKGKRMHFHLGKWLRKRYSHLLGPDYSETEVWVRSTDIDRTLMSAQANLAGMFPPTEAMRWLDNFPWQPVPVHTLPLNQDWSDECSLTTASSKPTKPLPSGLPFSMQLLPFVSLLICALSLLLILAVLLSRYKSRARELLANSRSSGYERL